VTRWEGDGCERGRTLADRPAGVVHSHGPPVRKEPAMRLPVRPALSLAALLVGLPAAAAERPYGIDKRVPWDASRVVGSPDPPPPYRVVRAFPKLDVPCPIAVAHEPGTKNLLLVHQHWPWGGAGRILRIPDDDNVKDPEVLISPDGIAYGVAFHPDFEKNGYLYVGLNGPMQPQKGE